MIKLSIASKMFEWSMKLIWPEKDSKLEQPRRLIGNILIWIHTTRRRVYYSILDTWGNYGYCVTDGGEKEDAKMRVTGFVFWIAQGYVSYLYAASGLAPWICKRYGHKLVDCSSAGPDSGDMDHACMRCGAYWHVPLY